MVQLHFVNFACLINFFGAMWWTGQISDHTKQIKRIFNWYGARRTSRIPDAKKTILNIWLKYSRTSYIWRRVYTAATGRTRDFVKSKPLDQFDAPSLEAFQLSPTGQMHQKNLYLIWSQTKISERHCSMTVWTASAYNETGRSRERATQSNWIKFRANNLTVVESRVYKHYRL